MSQSVQSVVLPGQTLGLLGGGQLGQMFAQKAVQMGYKVVCFSPVATPISRVAELIQAPFNDENALKTFVDQCEAVTLEFENVPLKTASFIKQFKPLRPGVQALETAQDRLVEKAFLQQAGCEVAPHWPVTSEETLQEAEALGQFPAVLKTARDGYDGKGQVKVQQASDLAKAWQALGQVACVLEAFIEFEQEISVMVARDVHGQIYVYPPTVNIHKHHILAQTWVGLDLPEWVLEAAKASGKAVAQGLDYVGCLCIEFFQTNTKLIVNEIAPRPHNSGHSTMESYSVCQYEQQVRALTGLPVVQPHLRMPSVLLNLLGQSPIFDPDFSKLDELLQSLLAIEGVHFHNYGKENPQKDRKMGHLVIEGESIDVVKTRLQGVEALLDNAESKA